jgi:hypothetical protein
MSKHMARFNHAFAFGFELENDSPEGEVTGQELRHAIVCRLQEMTDDEILDNCGNPWHTYENEADEA